MFSDKNYNFFFHIKTTKAFYKSSEILKETYFSTKSYPKILKIDLLLTANKINKKNWHRKQKLCYDNYTFHTLLSAYEWLEITKYSKKAFCLPSLNEEIVGSCHKSYFFL